MQDDCVCISRGRDAVVEPEARGRVLFGDDSPLKDAYTAYAAELEGQQSMLFGFLENIAHQFCAEAAKDLSRLETVTLAAYGATFLDQWVCMDAEKLVAEFDAHTLLCNARASMLDEAAVNFTRTTDLESNWRTTGMTRTTGMSEPAFP